MPDTWIPSWKSAPTVAEMRAKPCAPPKHGEQTRAETFAANERNDKKREAECKRIVWARDKGECRHCHVKVLKQLAYAPTRGETHHIASRSDKAVVFDPRNRILLCAACHELVERLKLFVVGTAKQLFTVGTKSYLNAECPLQFTKEKRS